MKNRFRIIKNRSRGGRYYLVNKETGDRDSLETNNKERANELLTASNESHREPAFNLQKARIYLQASDPMIATRTWQVALEAAVDSKEAGSANRHRWETAGKDEALDGLRKKVILETTPADLVLALNAGTVSTNVFLRRLHNFCIDMNWLPWPILAKKLWPKVKHKKKRAITDQEHLKIVAREENLERRNFYELCRELGGSQTDIANLWGEDIDWDDRTICYDRQKLASLDSTDIKPPLIRFGKRCEAILRSLPKSGPLFPYLSSVDCKDRASGVGRVGVMVTPPLTESADFQIYLQDAEGKLVAFGNRIPGQVILGCKRRNNSDVEWLLLTKEGMETIHAAMKEASTRFETHALAVPAGPHREGKMGQIRKFGVKALECTQNWDPWFQLLEREQELSRTDGATLKPSKDFPLPISFCWQKYPNGKQIRDFGEVYLVVDVLRPEASGTAPKADSPAVS